MPGKLDNEEKRFESGGQCEEIFISDSAIAGKDH